MRQLKAVASKELKKKGRKTGSLRMNALQIDSVNAGKSSKTLVVQGRAGKAKLELPKFALVGKSDQVILQRGVERRVWVKGEGEQQIPVLPVFTSYVKHDIAGSDVELRISEPTSSQEVEEYEALETFHYRGLDLSAAPSLEPGPGKKGTGGRRAVLLMHIKARQAWDCIGYIELQMPLMMCKPRHEAFDRPFAHSKVDAKWSAWTKGGQALVNRIVRIARVVVHPETRGTRLSSVLVSHAIKYAQERWHVGGRRPLFIEISAEMLRHIDFVSRCGFHYLGSTEGNRERLIRDLRSIKNGAKGASGIMSLQRRYHTFFESYRSKTGESFDELRARLAEVLASDDPWRQMDIEEWLALRPVIRSPIPYFMKGLDAESDLYVSQAVKALPKKEPLTSFKPVDEIHLRKVQLHSDYEVPLTSHSRLVMDSFGILTRRLRSRLLGPINFTAAAGTISFVSGASGCGKTVLLSALDPSWKPSTLTMLGSIVPKYSVGWLERLPPEAILFDYLANKHGAQRTFDALAKVGLSEALLLIKPFEMLSRGQRYRAMLADLLLGPAQVWLIDEFCSDLDPFTAKIVAHKLREIVRKEKRIAFVAAANNGHFIHELKPHRVLELDIGGHVSIRTWKEHANGVLKQAS